jgi:hypothetical protein
MSKEPTRKCGHRKIGGTYFVSDPGDTLSCIALPYNVTTCPCCFEGIKFSRGYKWVVPNKLFSEIDEICIGTTKSTCIVGNNCPLKSKEKSGIMWVGDKFYTPQTFTEEAELYGVSKRISAVPRDFEIGKTWVFLAHKRGGIDSNNKKISAIFYVFKPTRIEKVVTETQYKDKDEMEKLKSKGIIPIPVPDNDYDHRGSAYDRIHGKSLFDD